MWSSRPGERPTPDAALAITRSPRTHGSMNARRLAERGVRIDDAAARGLLEQVRARAEATKRGVGIDELLGLHAATGRAVVTA